MSEPTIYHRVYGRLLERGTSTVKELAALLDVPRISVHPALAVLGAMGKAEIVGKVGRRNIWRAAW